MPRCQHCGENFSVAASLKLHQKSAGYCLQIQKRSGLETEQTIYKCEFCNNVFTLKGSLTRHKTRCKYITTVPPSHDSDSIETENKEILADEKSDQTFECIGQKIAQLLDEKIMEKGMQQMISHIIPLFNQDGNWAVKVVDASRNKFLLRENGSEIVDNKGEKITKFIRHEFIKIIIPVLTEAYKSTDKNKIIMLETLASDLQNDKCYHQIVRGLIRFLPGQHRLYDFSSDTELNNSLNDLRSLLRRNEGNHPLPNGFIYVIKEREFVNTGEDIFKIGRTSRQIGERLCEYPKGSHPHYFENVKNCEEVEQLIIKKLILIPEEFIHRTDIGSEYFEGNISKLIHIIKSITLAD